MSEWLQAFSLGSAAILTNACVLPLYPGLIAFMAGNVDQPRSKSAWLGVLVLLGVLTMMLLVGLVIYLLQATFGDLLPYLLPLVDVLVIILGVLLILDRSPFARLATTQAPILRNRLAAAYVYGLLFGPMTLPCTGPIITSAFFLGADNSRLLIDGLVYFFFFGLGFGWPLVILPLIALPLQRRFVGWLAHHHTLLNRASGILLLAIGLFGLVAEWLPNVVPQVEVDPSWWGVYWAVVVVIIAAVWVVSSRSNRINAL
ncbi:MAG TPA: cytochrome c biogenesis protein CcdA [Phototrophicaceae bacterium]|nr:cytochrome c biogenesis protein CcdA [Phototrophicaceae bacterium]